MRRQTLVDVALGRAPPDLILEGGRLANVLTREIYEADVAIKDGRIAAVTLPGRATWPAACSRLDVTGRVIAPGFIDPHVHIESSMVSVTEYSRAAVTHGVTCVAADPHEIGNVLGVPGMQLIFDEAKTVPLKVLLRVPGRIPAMPEWLETSNGKLDVEGTRRMMDWPEAICLAGDINPALLLNNDAEQHEKMAFFLARNWTISGQSPGLSGRALNAYVAAGPEDSHVANNVVEIVENQRLGLRSVIALRPGRQLDRRHLRELATLVAERGLDPRFLQFCTDDIHAHDLLAEGHIDHRVRVAIEEGFDPLVALQMATLNVAEGLRIDRDYGSVAPGRVADIVILHDLATVAVDKVMIDGEIVVDGGRYLATPVPFAWPAWSKETIRVARKIEAADVQIRSTRNSGTAHVRAISAATPKEERLVELPVRDGVIQPDVAQDISSIAVIERHKASGGIGKGFVTGLSLRRGAIATTVSHDSHNIVVIGASHDDMAVAVAAVMRNGGGYAIACDGEAIFELPLPIAGLMSEASLETVAEQTQRLEHLLLDMLGCSLPTRPLMSFNFLCLPNIPRFGFTDKGMVSTQDLKIVDAVLDERS